MPLASDTSQEPLNRAQALSTEARKAPAPRQPKGLPTREELIAFIATHGGDVGKREISRTFGLDGGDRIVLKAMLRELADEGLIGRKRGKLHLPGALPLSSCPRWSSATRTSELLAVPIDWDEDEHGEAPRILVQLARAAACRPAPTVGDRVLLKTEEISEADGRVRHTGHVLKVLEKSRTLVLGL